MYTGELRKGGWLGGGVDFKLCCWNLEGTSCCIDGIPGKGRVLGRVGLEW